MPRVKTDELRLLRILSGCPSGATAFNLTQNHEIAPSTIYRAVELGLVHPEERTIRPPYGYKIFWLKITQDGRALLTQ